MLRKTKNISNVFVTKNVEIVSNNGNINNWKFQSAQAESKDSFFLEKMRAFSKCERCEERMEYFTSRRTHSPNLFFLVQEKRRNAPTLHYATHHRISLSLIKKSLLICQLILCFNVVAALASLCVQVHSRIENHLLLLFIFSHVQILFLKQKTRKHGVSKGIRQMTLISLSLRFIKALRFYVVRKCFLYIFLLLFLLFLC